MRGSSAFAIGAVLLAACSTDDGTSASSDAGATGGTASSGGSGGIAGSTTGGSGGAPAGGEGGEGMDASGGVAGGPSGGAAGGGGAPPLCAGDGGCPTSAWGDAVALTDATDVIGDVVGVVWDDGEALVVWDASSGVLWSHYQDGSGWTAPSAIAWNTIGCGSLAIAPDGNGAAHLLCYARGYDWAVATFEAGDWGPAVEYRSASGIFQASIAATSKGALVVWEADGLIAYEIVRDGLVAEEGALDGTPASSFPALAAFGDDALLAYEQNNPSPGDVGRAYDGTAWTAATALEGSVVNAVINRQRQGAVITSSRLYRWEPGTWTDVAFPFAADFNAIPGTQPLAIDDSGGLLVVWASTDGGTIQMAHANADDTWAEPFRIRPAAGGGSVSLASAPDGTAFIAWVNESDPSYIERSEYTPGAGWSAPERVAPAAGAPSDYARKPITAMSPSGNALLVWLQWPDWPGDRCVPIRYRCNPATIHAAVTVP